jgi:uncharacterized protein
MKERRDRRGPLCENEPREYDAAPLMGVCGGARRSERAAMTAPGIEFPQPAIEGFCRKWKIVEMALFGSALRDDFRPDSDLDFLVRFSRDASWGLLDHARMERELAGILGRPVDIVSRDGLEGSHNWIRRKAILSAVKVLYAA